MLNIREALGGELMGMTRFGHGTDDWPAYNMALNFLERGEYKKFRTLLFAHAAHHGLIDFHIYYEQVAMNSLEDKFKIRDSSLPSLVLNNLMINMMFAYETINSDEIHLLKGIPEDWLGKESFSAEGVYAGEGNYSIEATSKYIKVNSSSDKEVLLFLNGFSSERLEEIAKKNNLPLRAGALVISNPKTGVVTKL